MVRTRAAEPYLPPSKTSRTLPAHCHVQHAPSFLVLLEIVSLARAVEPQRAISSPQSLVRLRWRTFVVIPGATVNRIEDQGKYRGGLLVPRWSWEGLAPHGVPGNVSYVPVH